MSGNDDEAAGLHEAVAHALGFDDDPIDPATLVEERAPIDPNDIDDGTNEAIRQRILLGNTRDY